MKGLIQEFGQGLENQEGIELLTVTNNKGELVPPLDLNGRGREMVLQGTMRAGAEGMELPPGS